MINQNQQEARVSNPIPEQFISRPLYLDMSKVDTTWQEYNYFSAPVGLKKSDGSIATNLKTKALIKNDNIHRLLPAEYAVIVNEYMRKLSRVLVDESKGITDLEINREYTYHDGDTYYCKLLSNKFYSIKNHNGEDEQIKIGVLIRNGVGTNVALGVDVLTYRLVCSNGAIARGQDVGSILLHHKGPSMDLIKSFEGKLMQTLDKAENLLPTYQKSVHIPVDNALANKIYKQLWWIGEAYLPDNFNVLPSKEAYELHKKKEMVNNPNDIISIKGEPESLWEVFNAITAKQRERLDDPLGQNQKRKVSMGTIAYQQIKVHDVLVAAVNGKL